MTKLNKTIQPKLAVTTIKIIKVEEVVDRFYNDQIIDAVWEAINNSGYSFGGNYDTLMSITDFIDIVETSDLAIPLYLLDELQALEADKALISLGC
jgi:hypothetical protein